MEWFQNARTYVYRKIKLTIGVPKNYKHPIRRFIAFMNHQEEHSHNYLEIKIKIHFQTKEITTTETFYNYTRLDMGRSSKV